ncbi:MAG TPA: PKD domain-containing protein, partial [Candidatus Udaeobacter sp.]|nr:PKD domain-containing protein [Candidatus Udaeobacter sp.]
MPPVATLRLALPMLQHAPGLITACLAALFLAVGAAPALAIDDFQSEPLPISPVIGISPSTLTFSRCLTPNFQCQNRIVRLFNNVQDPASILQVTNIQISGAGFTLTGPDPPLSIPGDGTRIDFTVRFCPINGNPTPGTLIFTSPNATNSPLVYSFEGDGNQAPDCDAGGPYTGATGTPISFNGTASHDDEGPIIDYVWNFGDGGGSASGPTPTHTYQAGGTYNVLLTVRDDCSFTRTCSTTATVTGNLPPICDAGGPYSSSVGVPIQFDGTGSSDPDGFIVTYTWNFGGGATGAGPAPSHTYNTPGTRTVSLTVRDNHGAQSTCQTQVVVVSGDPVCDAGGPYLGLINAPIRFDASGSIDPNGTIVDYQWEFGDGAFGSGPVVTHAYSIVNDFTVRLCVEDNEGTISCCLTTARVRDATAGLTPVIGVFPQTLDFGACGNVGVPAERTLEVFNNVFDPTSLLHLTEAELDGTDFELVSGPTLPVDIPGDGTSVAFTFRFTPPDPELAEGTFTLTAPNASNSPAEALLRGRANVPPLCDAGGPYTGGTGENILFDASGSSDPGGISLSYRWDFGDGTTGIGGSILHRYTAVG